MQTKTMTFEETKHVSYDFTKRKKITVEPIEGGLILTAMSFRVEEGMRTCSSMLGGFGHFSETLNVAEAEALIKALTGAVDEVTRPVSAVYLDRNLQPVPEAHGIGHLQGMTVTVGDSEPVTFPLSDVNDIRTMDEATESRIWPECAPR